jgi:alpha-beta hydrolase superfamily lysophospholipase
MTPFDLAKATQLKQQLSSFVPQGEALPCSPLLDCYLDFYNLPASQSQCHISTGTISVNQQSLFCAAWQPANAVGTALLVHGYMDHVGLYGHLINFILSHKIAVVCFDLPGHGLSEGKTAYIDDFAEYTDVLERLIELCQQQFPGPLYGLGQSMGGAILLKHLINFSDQSNYPFKSLNLLAPLLHPKAWKTTRPFIPLIKPFKNSVKRVFRASSYDQKFLDFLRDHDPLQILTIPVAWLSAVDKWVREFESSPASNFPVTLIQGDADKTLDWHYNVKTFKSKLPHMQLRMINRANHHMVNEIEPLRREIFQAIAL